MKRTLSRFRRASIGNSTVVTPARHGFEFGSLPVRLNARCKRVFSHKGTKAQRVSTTERFLFFMSSCLCVRPLFITLQTYCGQRIPSQPLPGLSPDPCFIRGQNQKIFQPRMKHGLGIQPFSEPGFFPLINFLVAAPPSEVCLLSSVSNY